MTSARLLLDEMISPAVADQLRDRGHDVKAVASTSELVGVPDDQILEAAVDESRVVVTLNVADFAMLDSSWKAAGRAHGGIVYVSASSFPQDRRFIGSLVTALDDAAAAGLLPKPDEVAYLQPPRRRR